MSDVPLDGVATRRGILAGDERVLRAFHAACSRPLERAASLYGEAARLEATDPTALMAQAHVYEKLADKLAARRVYERVADGKWPERFLSIVREARTALGK